MSFWCRTLTVRDGVWGMARRRMVDDGVARASGAGNRPIHDMVRVATCYGRLHCMGPEMGRAESAGALRQHHGGGGGMAQGMVSQSRDHGTGPTAPILDCASSAYIRHHMHRNHAEWGSGRAKSEQLGAVSTAPATGSSATGQAARPDSYLSDAVRNAHVLTGFRL